MAGKNTREKGKIKLGRMFQKLEKGNKVIIKRELSERANFPKRIEGRTGIVTNRRGKAYIVKIRIFNQEKSHIIQPIHLKKI